MKTTSQIMCGISLLVSTAAFGQGANASANISATIVTPIAISKSTDMNFGNIAVSATVGGTAILAPAGTRTQTAGVTLPATTGTVAAASFNITGANNYTYSITLPSTATLSDGASHTMAVATFTSTPSGTGTLNATGSQTLLVGATLTVSAAQTVAAYTMANGCPVTVNYN